MAKKRRLSFIIGFVALFLVFWLVYMAVIFHFTSQLFRTSIEDRIHKTVEILDTNYTAGLDGLARAIHLQLDAGSTDIQEVFPIIDQIAAGRHFAGSGIDAGDILLADAGGALYARGGPVQAGLSPASLALADKNGFVVQSISGTAGEGVATVLPLTGNGLYLVEIRSIDAFARDIAGQLSFEPYCHILFDGQGQAVAHAGAANVSNYGDITESLRQGAESIRSGQDGSCVRQADFFFNYDIYIPLPMPEGWVLGGHISSGQVFPQYQSFFLATLIPMALWVFLLLFLIVYGIVQRSKKKKELYLVSRTDPLTKLSNSSGMDAALQKFFHGRPMQGYAMVCLDIVAFHRFNTMFGYATGDNLLRVLGKTLLSEYECGTRTSGDTFIFLAKNQPDTLDALERTLYDAIRNELGRQYVQLVSFNFGIYPILDDNRTLREIYDGALLALKDAKRSPDRNTVIYDQKLQQHADMQKQIEVNMLHALSMEEFRLYVQPKFLAANDSCCGGEVLVRWESEHMGFLSPGLFIPVFEANGFIIELDFFILDKTFALLQKQFDSGKPLYPLSVNQSRITIAFPSYLERLSRLVAQYTVPLRYIQIEITENALVNDSKLVLSLIGTYKKMGFSVAMDDFGTGYSSLNTLRVIPVDTLKIDKEFLRESNKSERSRKIIRSIINMALDLGISTVCEGVEEAAQYEFLKSSGCEAVQGFLFSKPVPSGEYIRKFASAPAEIPPIPV